jgi:hypothetical protein
MSPPNPSSETPSEPVTSPTREVRQMPGRFGIALNVAVQVLLTGVLFLGVNILSFQYYKRWDLTPAGSHTLSSVTLNNLRKLSKEVEVTLVFPRNSPMHEPVRALLEEYKRHGKKLIALEEIDPVRDVDRAEQLKVQTGLTLTQNGILVRTNKRQRYILEEELQIRDASKENNPVVGFRGEDAVTSVLIGLLEGAKKRIYLVVGKGARSKEALEGAGQAFADLARQQNFDLQVLNLAGVERIPEDAAGLLMVGLRYDLADRELAMLREYWRGERAGLLFLLDPNATTPRLHAFLAENGIKPRADRVLVAQSTSAGMRKEFAVEAGFSASSMVTQPLSGTLTVLPGQTQSLELPAEDDQTMMEQGLQVIPLIRAADRFWGERDFLDALPVAEVENGDTLTPVDVAASVERGVASDERLRVVSSRLVAVGNAELLNPETMLAECLDFVSASLNWVVNRERSIGITAKPKNAYRIQLNERQNQMLFVLTAFLLPALALMLGWMVWLTRRSA